MITVALPAQLQSLARTGRLVELEVGEQATQASVLDALEERYPELVGTIRDPSTRRRRPFVRFFACGEDLSETPPDVCLPAMVLAGSEPFVVLGAIAGG